MLISCCIRTNFLAILKVEGSPNADNLYETFNAHVESQFSKAELIFFLLAMELQSSSPREKEELQPFNFHPTLYRA